MGNDPGLRAIDDRLNEKFPATLGDGRGIDMEGLPEPQKTIVTPVKPRDPDCPWLVNVPVIEVNIGDVIEFDPAKHQAQIWMPVAEILGAVFIDLPGKPRRFTVIGGEPGTTYPYGFYLRDVNEMLEGESPPRIRLRR
jgi:hypothetical protein